MIRHNGDSRRPVTLDDVLSGEDDFGLLQVAQPPSSTASSAERRVLTTLSEINAFIEEHGREPTTEAMARGVSGKQEATLGSSLAALRQEPDQSEALLAHDYLGLLGDHSESDSANEANVPADTAAKRTSDASSNTVAPEDASTLDDILEGDVYGLLNAGDDDGDSIFDLVHVSEPRKSTEMPDDIAQRTHCDDFYRFEGLFETVRQEIQDGTAVTQPFQRESQISQGEFFIVGGMLCLVDHVGANEGVDKRENPRLRVVFDNGTESNMLQRSLSATLYKKEKRGKRVLRPDTALDEMAGVSHKDAPTGTIYILRTLSDDPALAGIRNLHKIGFTASKLSTRLAGAEKQKTYLEAPVQVVASFECYNLDPRRFETLIHAILHDQKVNAVLHDRDGSQYRPQEWFDVDLEAARQVVTGIVDGTILNYRMDNTTGRLVAKK